VELEKIVFVGGGIGEGLCGATLFCAFAGWCV